MQKESSAEYAYFSVVAMQQVSWNRTTQIRTSGDLGYAGIGGPSFRVFSVLVRLVRAFLAFPLPSFPRRRGQGALLQPLAVGPLQLGIDRLDVDRDA